MPHNAVFGLLDPVALVWEVEELGRYAATLECGEGGDPFTIHKAIVFGTVNDERGRLPVGHISTWGELVVEFRLLPRCALVFPLWEPELFGGEVVRELIESSVVVHEAFESF